MRRFLKLSPRDWQWLFNALVLSLLAMAILHAFMPYITTPNARIEEVRAVDRQIISVSAGDVPALLPAGKPAMLVIYASWCPYCRKLMPVVAQLLRGGWLKGLSPVFLSMDYEPRKLSKYLVYNDYYTLLTPYMLSDGLSLTGALPAALAPTGSHFTGHIPYIGFFNAEGKLTGELTGVASAEEVMEMIDKARK